MLNCAAKKGIFKGIRLANSSNQITHLQFADDTIIFLEDSIESIVGVKKVLQCFQLTSGLKINYGKSNIYSSHYPDSLLHEGARILNCKLGSWPMNYLGVPIGLTARKRIFWEPLVRKMKTKLASWKASSLNQAGRLTLVKAVLDNLPVYWMHLHQIPQSVTRT